MATGSAPRRSKDTPHCPRNCSQRCGRKPRLCNRPRPIVSSLRALRPIRIARDQLLEIAVNDPKQTTAPHSNRAFFAAAEVFRARAMDKQLEFSRRQIQNRSSGKSGTAATTPTAQAKSKPQATPGGRRADKHRRCHVTPRLRRLVD